MARIESPFCARWRFFADATPGMAAAVSVPMSEGGIDTAAWREIRLPHSMRELPFNGFDEKETALIGVYAKEFGDPRPSQAPDGTRVFLDFEGVMVSCRVFVNGLEAGSHRGGFTPFSVEIGRFLRVGGRNKVAVEVDSREDPSVPPFGDVVDYLCYGGIYRGVAMRLQDSVFMERLHVRPLDVLSGRKRLVISATLGGGDVSGIPPGLRFACDLRDLDGRITASASIPLSLGSGNSMSLEIVDIEGIELWSPDSPRLYAVEARLERDGVAVDSLGARVGFRSAEFRPGGFFLNGRAMKLRGLNRHQSWPYVGFAMGKRAQRRDAEILKNELGVDMVRCSHYPQSRHFLDACDELGLLVFEELPGWQHIGDESWKAQSLADLEAMILRDRNHPSIVLWGVRINESRDDDAFYGATNALAARFDPDRSTGGVRAIRKSRLLEDVYTYNDFINDGGERVLKRPRRVTGLKTPVPYLVTEHDGHMFPVKRFDNESRLAEQARRHARVLDAAYANPEIAGAIGWCAFDYNTHKDFGSGDRICYHGVSDMFREPKYAAAVYASQVDPAKRVVLEAATLFAKGERDAARTLPIEIWTNCDEIELYRSGDRVGRFLPDRKRYPNLPHPPVVVDDIIGDRIDAATLKPRDKAVFLRMAAKVMRSGADSFNAIDKLRTGMLMRRSGLTRVDIEALIVRFGVAWGGSDDSIELVGYVGGREVARKTFGSDARAFALKVEPEGEALIASGEGEEDALKVAVRIVDQYGNLCPFVSECVSVRIEGPGRLLGPSRLPVLGGTTAFWVASGVENCVCTDDSTGARKDVDDAGIGEIRIVVESTRFPPQRAAIRLEAEGAREMSDAGRPV